MAPWVRRYEDPTCRSRGGAVVRLLGANRLVGDTLSTPWVPWNVSFLLLFITKKQHSFLHKAPTDRSNFEVMKTVLFVRAKVKLAL